MMIKKIKKIIMKKFSWGEMTSNHNNKTSASGTMGIAIVTVGLISFILSVIGFIFFKADIVLIYQTIAVISLGTGLLGYKKNHETKQKKNSKKIEKIEVIKQINS